jgi:glycerol-3-phosphate cytidylyltransferase-like family protein
MAPLSYDAGFDGMFKLLLEFKQKHGHLKVPRKDNKKTRLGRWVQRRRSDYREYKRTNGRKGEPERMKHLESIGLVDDISTGYEKACLPTSNWDGMFNQLLEFKKKHGHVKVSHKTKLGSWVTNQRSIYREYRKTNCQKGEPERMKRLESIGLVDDISTDYEKDYVPDYSFDGMFKLLLEFKQKHGHLKVPRKYNKNPRLARWVQTRRSDYREYKRTNGQKGNPERMKHLESIGLVDDISTGYEKACLPTSNWDGMFNQLLEFKKKHGHVKVSQQCKKNKKLGIWVMHGRKCYREYKRTNGEKGDPKRMKRLESIGMVDDIISKYEDEKMHCTDDKVSAPIIVSPTLSSNTQTITEEMPLLTGMEVEEKNADSGGVDTQADLDVTEEMPLLTGMNGEEKNADSGGVGTQADLDVMEEMPLLTGMKEEEKNADNCGVGTQADLDFTEEIPLLTGMKKEEKNPDCVGVDTQVDLDPLGSELRGKGGFWV